MKEHGDIRVLIGSMTGSEKRYFKLNGGKNGRKASTYFMDFFDAIDKGKEVTGKGNENHAVTARYLTESILDCLDAYNAKNSIDANLDKQIRHGTVLHNKGLHQQALKTFLKAETIAKTQQDFVRLQQIYWYMRMLLAIGTKHGRPELTMEYVLEHNLAAVHETSLMARLRFVEYRFQRTSLNPNDASNEILLGLKELINSDAMLEVDEHSGFFSQVTAENLRSKCFDRCKDYKAGLKQGKKVFELCYSHRELLQDRGRMLIAGANNYMARCFNAREFDEMKRVIDLLEKETPKNDNVEIMRLETYFSSLLVYNNSTKQFNDKKLLPSIEKKMEKVGAKMNQAFLMLIYCHCSHYAFFQNNLSEALKWINLYLNHENRNALKQNLPLAFDYRLIIYYEQNKFELLESLLRSKGEKNAQGNEFSKISKCLRNFLKNELKKETEQKENLRTLCDELLKLKATGTEKEDFDFFPFDEWVELKIIPT
ncbi:MAG: hypothetical protein JKX84_05145 [Flavobacteriales bacterium]|nr:hypothetical protein [Flavobacteriales bacterium]